MSGKEKRETKNIMEMIVYLHMSNKTGTVPCVLMGKCFFDIEITTTGDLSVAVEKTGIKPAFSLEEEI